MSSEICPKCGRPNAESRPVPTYHYHRESGLENVWLRGGVTETVCERCGQTCIRIEKEWQLLQVVALRLLMKQGPLTGPEMRFVRSACEMSQAELAKALKLGRRPTVSEREAKEKPGLTFAEELGLRLILLQAFRHYVDGVGRNFLTSEHRKTLDEFTDSFARSAIQYAERGQLEKLTAELDPRRELWRLPGAA